MKHMKKAICFIMIILIAIGACGCMNHNEYSEKILKELSDKYNKTFEIVEMSYAVDGEHGNYYHAVCREQGSEFTFAAYYYLNGSDYLLSEDLSGESSSFNGESILVDEYSNLLLADKLNNYLLSSNADILFTAINIYGMNYEISLFDVEQGLEHCLSNEAFRVVSKVCIFADLSIENKEDFENNVIKSFLNYNTFQQSIHFVYIDSKNSEDIKRDYQDDFYRIDERLKDDVRVNRYKWVLIEEKEITSKEDIKGV